MTVLVASPGAAQTLDTASPAATALEDAKTPLKGGSYGTALEAAERLLAIEPSSLAGHYIAGAALIRLGRLDEAESHLGTVEAASPKWAGLQFQFGYLAFTRAEQIPSGTDVERQRSLYL